MDHKESWASKNRCFWTVVLEKILESPLDCKEIQPVHPKGNQSYSLEAMMLKLKLQYFGTWCEELTDWKRLWCWERLKAGREGEDRGWDGWMASPTQWTWVWASSRSWWWAGRPGVLQSMGSQRVRHDWETELNWSCVFTFSFLRVHHREWLQGVEVVWWLLDGRYSFPQTHQLTLEECNHWWLWHPCLFIWHKIFHFSYGC